MKQKRILAVIIACAVITSGLAACSSSLSGNVENIVAVTEAVTDADGEVVTDESGEIVTEVVTDESGAPVTEVVKGTTTTTTTEAAESKTETSSGKSSITKKKETTTNEDTTSAQDQYIEIVLQKNRTAKCNSPNVTIATGEVLIDQPGDYLFTSTTSVWYGQITVKLKNDQEANLRFENVNIESERSNVLQIIDSSITSNRSFIEAEATAGTEADDQINEVADSEKAPNVSISFPQGTSSTFTSTANGYTGIIYNESKLTIKGRGSCSITCDIRKANNCICSTKSITVKNVNLNMTTAQYKNTESLAATSGSAKGIFSYSKVYVESGTININSNGDCVRCDSFYSGGGTMNFKSSACDAVDADDVIEISGESSIKAIALSKYSFKVRRVNNSENGRTKGVRSGKGDGFRINGGIAVGESKKISSLNSIYQSDKKGSGQASITGKIVKKSAGGENAANESKVPGIFKISALNKTSSNSCTKYLYSSSKIKKGTAYKVTANSSSANVVWSGNYGEARIVSSTGK